jgi:undecaprenyl pyrophosphate synthase
MSTIMAPRRTNVLRALTRAIGLTDREGVLRAREQLRQDAETAARARAQALEAAVAAVEAWREPERRLRRLQVEIADAARAEAHAAAILEGQLRANTPACVTALVDHVRDVYSTLNRGAARPGGMTAVAAALVTATWFCRDVGWRLPEAEARARCDELRAAIAAAMSAMEQPADEDAAS